MQSAGEPLPVKWASLENYYRQQDEFYLQKIQDPDEEVHGGTRPLLTSASLWQWICREECGYPQEDDDESAYSYHWRGILEVEQYGQARDGDDTNELFLRQEDKISPTK